MVLQPHPILASTAIGIVYTHGFFFAMAGFVGVIILLLQRRFLKLRAAFLIERAAWIFLIGLFSARLGYFISYPNLWQNVGQLFAIWQGGLVSYWGMIGGAVVVLLAARKMPLEQRWKWCAAVSVALWIAWGVGRIGNFFAADSVGVLSPYWAVTYGRVPIQLFESLLCFLIGIWGYRHIRKNPVRVVWVTWMAYFVGRTLIDTWRDEATVEGIHVSQLVSFIIVIVLITLWRKKHVKQAALFQ